MEQLAFAVLSLLALVSALVVVTHRNSVVSALALAFNLVSIAGFYFLLGAQFIALLQVIVYAGAIMVLILFVIMLLNLKQEMREHPAGKVQGFLAALLGIALALVLGRAVLGVHGSFSSPSAGFGTVEALGRELYGRFFYPFEVVSLLLIAAMVGAVLLAKEEAVIIPHAVLLLSALLFTLGALGVLLRRGAITILMCVELMLNAANLAFITFSRQLDQAEGQVYVFFVITLAAAEAAVGLAIVIALFRLRETTDVDEINLLKW